MAKQEPVRVSSAILFERNLLDPVVLISTFTIYLLCCTILASDASFITFLVTFSSLSGLFNYHLEAYRSFKIVRKSIQSLESDDKPALRDFLSVHLRYLKPNYVFNHPERNLESAFASFEPKNAHDQQVTAERDTYRWANKLIGFFWPYLSHVAHHELNQFLSETKTMAYSRAGIKRFLYALFRQVDANILAVEQCELGSDAPFIRGIHVVDKAREDDSSLKSLVYDLDLVYEGNMNISFICRYFCCCNSRIGLKDVFIHLSSRVVVGPIDDQVPWIEELTFSLMKLPKFGYKGIALVELAELRLAKRSINRIIKEHILYPRAYSLLISNLAESMKHKKQAQPEVRQPGQIDAFDSNIYRGEPISWTTRVAASLTFCVCLCANSCLRFCQKEKRSNDSRRLERLRYGG